MNSFIPVVLTEDIQLELELPGVYTTDISARFYIVAAEGIEQMVYNQPICFHKIMDYCPLSVGGVYPVREETWMDMGQLEELETMRKRLEING